jgi:hypothetical protein
MHADLVEVLDFNLSVCYIANAIVSMVWKLMHFGYNNKH